MFRDAYKILFALVSALLDEPDGFILVHPQVSEPGEMLESYFSGVEVTVSQLLYQRLFQICVIVGKITFFVVVEWGFEAEGLDYSAPQTVHYWDSLCKQDEQNAADESHTHHHLVL